MKRMTRILAAALAVVLVLCAAGCGKKEPDLKSALTPVQTSPAAPVLPTINPAAPAEEPTEAPTEEAFAGTLVETDYFRFSYTEEWQFDAEEDLEVSTRSVEAAVTLPDEDGESKLLRLTIEVKFNARPDYDLDLHLHNMDAREMVLNNAYETEQVGGMDFVVVEGYSSRTYMAYDDAANAYVNIYVSDERDDPRVAELLNTLRFTLPTSYEGEQTPWHWEGTPYTPPAALSRLAASPSPAA